VTATLGSLSPSFSLTNQAMPAYTVTTLTDDAARPANCNDTSSGAPSYSSCSLRDAIAAAALIAQTSISPATTALMPTINFSNSLGLSAGSPGVYSVKVNGALKITANMDIVGPGASLLNIDGGKAAQVFSIKGSNVTASISGLTIANGYSDDSRGGGIDLESGTLTVGNSTFSGNTSSFGGGVDSTSTMTVSNSTFTGNSASEGGGIENIGTLTVNNSTFSGNTASMGGGIGNRLATLMVSNSIFSGNTAAASSSGGDLRE